MKHVGAVFLTLLLSAAACAFDLDGVWVRAGAESPAAPEFFMEIEGKEYVNETGGTIVDSGTFEVAEGEMRGKSRQTGEFVRGFKMDPDGDSFTLVMENGCEFEYRRYTVQP